MCTADYIRAYTSYIRVEKKQNTGGMGAYMVVMGRGWGDGSYLGVFEDVLRY